MNNITINITVSQGGVVNINNNIPYKTVQTTDGMLHTFYNKEDYNSFIEELKDQK